MLWTYRPWKNKMQWSRMIEIYRTEGQAERRQIGRKSAATPFWHSPQKQRPQKQRFLSQLLCNHTKTLSPWPAPCEVTSWPLNSTNEYSNPSRLYKILRTIRNRTLASMLSSYWGQKEQRVAEPRHTKYQINIWCSVTPGMAHIWNPFL